ncbi:asparagine synthetase B family protein, partial [Sphingomonas sp. HMWF008]
ILHERRTGVQAANWFSAMEQRRATIRSDVERLESSPLARQMLDLPRLKALAEGWPSDAAGAQARAREYRLVLARGLHMGAFIRWVEGGNG